jgi:predicted nucleic acid-binding protein
VILVDTSIWIDFLRGTVSTAPLSSLLADGEVLVHPWIIGELSLGRLGPRRPAILADLERLPAAPVAGARLWTSDRRLRAAGRALGVC